MGRRRGWGTERESAIAIESARYDSACFSLLWFADIIGFMQTTQPRRRGFDALLDAGLSAAEVANMRRQFYAGRGEEVPEGLEQGES